MDWEHKLLDIIPHLNGSVYSRGDLCPLPLSGEDNSKSFPYIIYVEAPCSIDKYPAAIYNLKDTVVAKKPIKES